jgi:hypothetical protein
MMVKTSSFLTLKICFLPFRRSRFLDLQKMITSTMYRLLSFGQAEVSSFVKVELISISIFTPSYYMTPTFFYNSFTRICNWRRIANA